MRVNTDKPAVSRVKRVINSLCRHLSDVRLFSCGVLLVYDRKLGVV